jgi:hypothetical protein
MSAAREVSRQEWGAATRNGCTEVKADGAAYMLWWEEGVGTVWGAVKVVQAKLLTGDRIFWEARGVAYCSKCGEARDDGERAAYEFERTMRETSTPVAVGVDW